MVLSLQLRSQAPKATDLQRCGEFSATLIAHPPILKIENKLRNTTTICNYLIVTKNTVELTVHIIYPKAN